MNYELTISIIFNILLAIVLLLALLIKGNFRWCKGARVRGREEPPKILLIGMDEATTRDLTEHLGDTYELHFLDYGGVKNSPFFQKVVQLQPALIISEYLMPDLNGAELCHALKLDARTARIPVVFLTALAHRADINYGIEAGAVEYITKPYQISVLRQIIQDTLSCTVESGELRTESLEFPTGLQRGFNPSADSRAIANSNLSFQDREFLDRLHALFDKHLSDSDFVVSDICKELAMSRTSAFTRIKAVTGHSPNDYLRLYRMNEARRLVEARLWTISEIATKVGYSDPKYFSTSFKKCFGIQPSKLMRSANLDKPRTQ